MGAAIGERLLSLGHTLHVWNRTPHKMSTLVALGAQVAATPAGLSASSDVVLTVLTDSVAVTSVYLDASGLLEKDVTGKLFIEMSTVGSDVQRILAREVRARGGHYVESPVGGSVTPAREGKLFAFVGGDHADVQRAVPLLRQICRRIEHVGDAGAGAAVKLAVNLPMHVYWEALREALIVCEPLELEPARLVEIFADTSGAPASLRARARSIVDVMTGTKGAVDFDIDSIRKDLALAIEQARAAGHTLPVAECALHWFDEASLSGSGHAAAAALLMLRK
jgi:3-hydroxyisobutyrate dehydrogenase